MREFENALLQDEEERREEEAKKGGREEDQESNGSEGRGKDDESLEPDPRRARLTKASVEELKEAQARDVFEDIQEVKNQVKLSSIKSARHVIPLSLIC